MAKLPDNGMRLAAGALIGFSSEDDWFEYFPENDPDSLNRIADEHESQA